MKKTYQIILKVSKYLLIIFLSFSVIASLSFIFFSRKLDYKLPTHTSYDVYDPTTRKPIQVTMLYNMAPLMVEFMGGGRHRPLCGPANGMDITDYIPGTVRFTPRITPKVNQKSLMEDIRVNYAAKVNASSDALTIETCYTSQEAFTQASFIVHKTSTF